METINSMASAAAKAVWGESNDSTTTSNKEIHEPGTTTTTNMSTTNETQGQEPISGKLGDTSKGEPFDAGNIESGDVAQTKTPATEAPTTGAPTTTTTTTTNDSAIGTENKTQSKGPTADQPSTTGDTGFKAAQADIRDPESNPTTDPKKEAERKNVDDTGALDASENPGKVDGAGPRPVEEVARDHGGDAGAVAGAGAGQSASNEGGEKLGSSGEEDKGESKGTGEEYIKSSGLKADGGDFDATKPGAGREADRLLEEKGLANPAAAAAAGGKKEDVEDDTAASPDSKEKKSLKDKIKAKLHKN